MTFGSGGGAPKTISIVTDTAPVVQSFANREFYTCPLDTLAIVSPILFSYGTGSLGDPDVFNFAGINVKSLDPITGATLSLATQFGAISGAAYTPSPNYGRSFLSINAPDTSSYLPQRYDKYAISNVVTDGGGGPIVTSTVGYGAGILVFPGETLRWGASNSYINATQWRLRYALIEYGIST